jgi:hypothetical protein
MLDADILLHFGRWPTIETIRDGVDSPRLARDCALNQHVSNSPQRVTGLDFALLVLQQRTAQRALEFLGFRCVLVTNRSTH